MLRFPLKYDVAAVEAKINSDVLKESSSAGSTELDQEDMKEQVELQALKQLQRLLKQN